MAGAGGSPAVASCAEPRAAVQPPGCDEGACVQAMPACRARYSLLFQLCEDLARRPCVSEYGECLRCHGGCPCRACALAVQPWDFSDEWHPSLFEDSRSCHVNEVRRATRRAQYYQLQCSGVRRDNTTDDIRAPVWAPVPDSRPRAGDPRAM